MTPDSPPTVRRHPPEPFGKIVLPHPDRTREDGPDLRRPPRQAPRRTGAVPPPRRERIG